MKSSKRPSVSILVSLFLLLVFVACSSDNGGGNTNREGAEGTPQGSSQFAGVWTANFSGGDSGTVAVQVNAQGAISGTGNSVLAGTFAVTGTVNESGSTVITSSGGADTGAQFVGTLTGGGTGTGTWTNTSEGLNGTWTAIRN